VRRRNAILVALAGAAVLAAARPPRQVAATPAGQRRAPITLLIGLDAFRWDYVDRPQARNIRALAERGVRVERLLPSFPSKTYPNFYTLVTGLYPDHHGIIANVVRDSVLGTFRTGSDPAVRDGRWFGGEPIWVTAERNTVPTAVYFWPADEAEIRGVRPREYAGYDGRVSRADRVRWVLDRLARPAASAPRLITLYLEDVDNASHAVGPNGARTDTAIAAVDSVVGALVDGIDRLGLRDVVNVVVTADHGMAEVSRERVIVLDDYVPLDSLTVVDWTPVAWIEPRRGAVDRVYARLKGAHPHLSVYRKGEIPARLKYGTHPRVTSLVAIADEGWTITSKAELARPGSLASRGAHGYDNALLSMGATLVGAGPGLARGVRTPPMQNVHVYSLLAALLGVPPAATDGSIDSVRALLRR
jgi:predicted AlkP superfamily pyrophosphatase or phosphodiesterase